MKKIVIITILTMVVNGCLAQVVESILTYPVPATEKPVARLFTDIFNPADFVIDGSHVVAEYFSGGDSAVLESFRQEYKLPLYMHMTAKPLMNNNLTGYNFTIHSYYKAYEFHQAKMLEWMRKNRPQVKDILPHNARKMNPYRGDLINPIVVTAEDSVNFDLKKTFGKRVTFRDGKVFFLQDNRLNPYRWMAPNNAVNHHETSSIFMENYVSEQDRVRVREILENYRTGKDRSKRILFRYSAVIKVTDYRQEMGEYSIYDMYTDEELEHGTDFITAIHRRWNEKAEGNAPINRWMDCYKKSRFEKPFVQVSACVNMNMANNRYILQEFMFFNKDYESTTCGHYRPVYNETISEHMYEGGCSGFVGWNRLATDALKIEGLTSEPGMPIVVDGCEYVDVSGDNSKVIEREVSGTIDITNFNLLARKHRFFPGEDGFYIDDKAMHGFNVPGTPEYEPNFLPSIFWAGFMFEMAGPYKLEIEIKEFDIQIVTN